jgi:hypothetical protein
MKRSTQPLPSGSRTKAGELALVVDGDELAAVVVAHPETACDALGEGTEAGAHALTERLERLEARGAARGVDAQAFLKCPINTSGIRFKSNSKGSCDTGCF